jgi:hypothetical protein
MEITSDSGSSQTLRKLSSATDQAVKMAGNVTIRRRFFEAGSNPVREPGGRNLLAMN